MDNINFNKILDRESIEVNIIKQLKEIYEHNENKLLKKGFYIYGAPGSGKTQFVENLLKNN